MKIYYEKRPAGIIFLGGNPERYEADFNQIKVPCVLITNQANNVSNKMLSSVGTDDISAAQEIAEYLIANGHRNIGVIGGDINKSEISDRRFKGFMKAMKKHDLPFDFETHYQTAKYSFEGGEKAAEELIEKFGDMTAVFSMSDVQAIGAIRKLTDRGLRVPQDISVTGFDGLPLTQYMNPRLTTIRQYEEQLAECGTNALLETIGKAKQESSHILIPFELLKGESVISV